MPEYGELIAKSKTDIMRIYGPGYDGRYRLWVNCLWDGEPTYAYNTLKGAKIAMRMFESGRYKDRYPSTAWE